MDWNKIGAWVLGIAIGGLLIAAWRGASNRVPAATAETPSAPLDQSSTPANTSVTEGPSYLIYNQGPWAFAPPVMNFLPSMIAPGGAPVLVTPQSVGVDGKYGCFEC